MSHLLVISVGPVQEFISAARRTRDLWFGSHLLSKISRAVAEAVRDAGGELIFPADLDVENVANVILAEVKSADPKTVAAIANEAAVNRWLQFVNEALEEAHGVIRHEIWEEQREDVIEFYAAWVPHHDPANYSQDRATLMRLLAGRKNCRDFLPAKGRVGVPKSSLDGLRESVLKDSAKEPWPERFRARLRIRVGEQLDVVGLVKRVAGGQQRYPSVSRVAADPWVRGCHSRLSRVLEECERLGSQVIRELDISEERGHPHYHRFPYEGTAVFVSRHHELVEEADIDRDRLRGLREALTGLREPNPYLAVLVADGDRIGATISRLTSAADHQQFSRKLAEFATAARKIVNDHHGVLVYAGGDDVLAFLPVDLCLPCARALHGRFGELLADYRSEDQKPPTLSVGVAIGHFMENLEDLLEYGRAAEKAAKQIPDKDALAVHLHKRGGAPIGVAARWDAQPDCRLQQFAEWIKEDVIPSRLPYEMRTMAHLYRGWDATASEAIRLDLIRLIARKQSRGAESVAEVLGEYLSGLDSARLGHLSHELLVARQLAVAFAQARGQSSPDQEDAS